MAESMAAEAARRGVSYYQVRDERAAGRGLRGYGHEQQFRKAFRQEQERQQREGPHGMQSPFGPSVDDWDYYWPTRTIRPMKKYTQFARYSRNSQRLEVVFRDGTPWHWDEVPADIWIDFKRNESTYYSGWIRGPGNAIGALGRGDYGGWGNLEG